MQTKSTNGNQRTMKTSELVRRFLPYFRPYRGMLALDLFCAMLTTLCDLVLPMIVRSITGLAMVMLFWPFIGQLLGKLRRRPKDIDDDDVVEV